MPQINRIGAGNRFGKSGKPTGFIKEIEEKYVLLSSELAHAYEQFAEVAYADANIERPGEEE